MVFSTVLTVALNVSPLAAVLSVSWVPLFMVVSYLMLKSPKTCFVGDSKTNYGDYNSYKPSYLMEQNTKTRLSTKENFLAIWDTLQHFIALVVGIFSAFLSVQGITSTIVYKHTELAPREVYVVYNNTFTIATFVSQSYSFAISFVNPSCNSFTKHTWALATIEVAPMFFLLVDSWYRFLNSIILVGLLLAIVGLVFRVLCVNVFTMVGVSEDSRKSALTMAFCVCAFDSGMLLAGLMALYVEPVIHQHCLYLTNDKVELCLARLTMSVL